MSTTTHIALLAGSANAETAPGVEITKRDRAWLSARLERGKRERFTEIATITPGIASLILEQNIGNRRIRQSRLRTQIDRLQRGDFILTHQGVSIAKVGVLNDGQHRLCAIVATGIPAQMQITFGAEREEFHVIDQNAGRGAADTLGIEGKTHAALRASLAKQIMIVEGGLNEHPDPQLVADFAIDMGDKLDAACVMGMSMKKVTNPTSAALAHYWINAHSRKPGSMIDEFWDGLPNGEGLHGIKLRLREFLASKTKDTLNPNTLAVRRAAAIIAAWNAWTTGRHKTRAKFETAWMHSNKLPNVV